MPKKKRNLIAASIVTLIIITLIVIRIANSSSVQRGIPAPVVEEGKITRGEIVKSESFTGDILPIQQASVYTKVNGNIEAIYVDIGDKVKKGQILALIDTTIYSQNMRQAKANYMQALANFENEKITFERNQKLFEDKLIAKQDLDNAKTAMDVSSAQEESANAAYSNAQTQLSYCRIIAPFSGFITKRYYDPGAYVTSSNNNQSSILFDLMNTDKLKSMVNIPEKDVPLLSTIKDIEVIPDALPGKVYHAVLKKISEAVDLDTRTMAVEIDIENPTQILKPGMFATITIILQKDENSLILPNEVVLNDEQGNYVYTINHDNTVSKKYVQVGIQQDNKDEILSGVDEKDRIVFVGQTLIKDRMKVKIAKQ
jgi:membrane fusion protein, multidrug efflux system